jgi:hypothetical protein
MQMSGDGISRPARSNPRDPQTDTWAGEIKEKKQIWLAKKFSSQAEDSTRES